MKREFLTDFVRCGECNGTGWTPSYDYCCERCGGFGKYIAPVTAFGHAITNPALLDPHLDPHSRKV